MSSNKEHKFNQNELAGIDECLNLLDTWASGTPFAMRALNKVCFDRADFYDLLNLIRENLPKELEQAKNVVAQCEIRIKNAQEQAAKIIHEAEVRQQDLIKESIIVKDAEDESRRLVNAAQQEAQSIRDAANHEARGIKIEALDYALKKMSNSEKELERVYSIVSSVRAKIENELKST